MSIKRQKEGTVATRLDKESLLKFNQLAAHAGRSRADLLREAALFYMKYKVRQSEQDIDSKYVATLQKSTNRTCSLLAKIALDVSTLAHFMHASMDQYGQEQFKEAYQNAIKRVRARLNGVEKEVVEVLADGNP